VRITETRHCGEKLQSMLSDPEGDRHCAENQNHTAEDIVDSGMYECFVGALAYLQEGNCQAQTLLNLDSTDESFSFNFFSVIGHPQDPFGVFR
jgi:hypothetical protein